MRSNTYLNANKILSRKGLTWVLSIATACLVLLYFRHSLIFYFQYQRLKQLRCATTNSSCRSKIWVHRVNSLERLSLVAPYFDGVEADVTFDEKRRTLLVYHPPFNGRVILFEHWLQQLKKSNKKAWIDLRAITDHNRDEVFQQLLALERKYQFRNQLIFELYHVAAANKLAENDFIVSMNIPVDRLSNKDSIIAFSKSISPQVPYISQEDHHITFMKTHFPDKRIITWSVSFRNYFNTNHLQNLILDEKIDVVLVNIKSRYRF